MLNVGKKHAAHTCFPFLLLGRSGINMEWASLGHSPTHKCLPVSVPSINVKNVDPKNKKIKNVKKR